MGHDHRLRQQNRRCRSPGGDAGSPAGPARDRPLGADHRPRTGDPLPLPDRRRQRLDQHQRRPVLPHPAAAADGQRRRSPTSTRTRSSSHARSTPAAPTPTYSFEYGTERLLAEPGSLQPGRLRRHATSARTSPSTPASSTLGGLEPGTTYHYRRARDQLGGDHGRPATAPSRPIRFSDRTRATPARTRSPASRPARRCSPTAAPTSSSPPPRRRLRRRVGPGPRPGTVRRLPGGDGARPGPLRGPQRRDPGRPRQPDQPRRRPLRRDPRRQTAGRPPTSASRADNPNATGLFASTLAEADPELDAFAFGGPADLRALLRRRLDRDPAAPAGRQPGPGHAGLRPGPERRTGRARPASASPADGTHLVFGSTAKFEPSGNDERRRHDLRPQPRPPAAGHPGRLDRPPAGGRRCTPAPGHRRARHLRRRLPDRRRPARLHRPAGNALLPPLHARRRLEPKSIDLTPGATAGVLYDGMTADGSQVFFTTRTRSPAERHRHQRRHLPRRRLGAARAPLTVSTAPSTGNATPAPRRSTALERGRRRRQLRRGRDRRRRRSRLATRRRLLPLAPELDSTGRPAGSPNQPTSTSAGPGGAPQLRRHPRAVDNPVVVDAVQHSGERRISPTSRSPRGGESRSSRRRLPLTGYDNDGHSEVYRYDAGDRRASTAPPAADQRPRRPATRASPTNGLSLTDDGRVFFNTDEPLVLRDGDNRKDVYEWEERGLGQLRRRRTRTSSRPGSA